MSLDPSRHICQTCYKEFSKPSTLRDHENVHSGLKPYSCKYCGRSFANHGTRHQHERTHLKGQHICGCGSRFKRPQELNRHQALRRVECSIDGTNTASAPDGDHDMESIIGEGAQTILGTKSSSLCLAKRFRTISHGSSCYPCYGSPQNDLQLSGHIVVDWHMVSFKALIKVVTCQFRYLAGDIEESSFVAHIQASADESHRYLDYLALQCQHAFMLFEIIVTISFTFVCRTKIKTDLHPREPSIEALATGFERRTDVYAWWRMFNASNAYGGLGDSIKGLRSSFFNNYRELLDMGTSFCSVVGNMLIWLPSSFELDILLQAMLTIRWVHMFCEKWNVLACSGGTSRGRALSQAWNPLITMDHMIWNRINETMSRKVKLYGNREQEGLPLQEQRHLTLLRKRVSDVALSLQKTRLGRDLLKIQIETGSAR